jgi:hypothetical protein
MNEIQSSSEPSMVAGTTATVRELRRRAMCDTLWRKGRRPANGRPFSVASFAKLRCPLWWWPSCSGL